MGGDDVAASTHDIENPLETIERRLKGLRPLSPLPCIHRVPDRFHRERERDYTPRVISIGPYHHGNEALKSMEDHKLRYVNCFLHRSHAKPEDYVQKIRKKEQKLRNYYSETIVLNSNQFVTMVLVDAIFLLEFLLRSSNDILQDENDCIFGTPKMLPDVANDLLMLENQLPLFILEVLLSLYNRESRGYAKRLYIKFLMSFSLMAGYKNEYLLRFQVKGQHSVDLLRNLLLLTAPRSEERENPTGETETAPTIERLHLSGVKFINGGESITGLFDITFNKHGILKIPKLRTDDTTELILRNLIAFEQCSNSNDRIISDYVSLMDMLIDSPRDVELLVKHNIIENDLGGGDKDVANMINGLSAGIIYYQDFYYDSLCGKLNTYCSSRRHKWIAKLRSDYFHNPWSTISVVAAVVLLILTAIQTICAVYQLL
ncbi:hypothetical protein ACLB2K_017306 [Fragaria x ananassa]